MTAKEVSDRYKRIKITATNQLDEYVVYRIPDDKKHTKKIGRGS